MHKNLSININASYLAEMVTLQTKKIEELTLHLIKQQKEIEMLKQNLKK